MMPVVSRIVLKINVTPAAKQAVEKWKGLHGMSEFAVASRVYEWFGEQDDEVQRAILGLFGPRLKPDVAKDVLDKLAGWVESLKHQAFPQLDTAAARDGPSGKIHRRGTAGSGGKAAP